MDALLVSTVFGLGLLFLFDGLVRPHTRIGAIDWVRRLGPRSVAAAVGAMVGFIATGWPIAALAGGLVAASVPEILRRTNVAEHAPASIRADLRRLVSDARVSGLAEAALAFADRVPDPSADLLASALGTAERLGSRNLSEVLDALAEATTAQAAAIREARARQTRNRVSARIVAAVPILLLLAIRQANPAYLAPFETASGQAILAFAFGLIWAGYVAMQRAARIEGPAR